MRRVWPAKMGEFYLFSFLWRLQKGRPTDGDMKRKLQTDKM